MATGALTPDQLAVEQALLNGGNEQGRPANGGNHVGPVFAGALQKAVARDWRLHILVIAPVSPADPRLEPSL